jgi:hypothetical protein
MCSNGLTQRFADFMKFVVNIDHVSILNYYIWVIIFYMFQKHRLVLFLALFSLIWPFLAVIGQVESFSPLSERIFPAREAFAQAAALTELEQQFNWEKRPGDRIFVDLNTNEIYFQRAYGSAISARIQGGSGVNRMVTWLGMTYNGATPEGKWLIKEKVNKNLFWVFGSKESSEQLFFRMFRLNEDGSTEFTHYGIHTTPNIDSIITNSAGYGSYGCVLTSYDLLKFVEEMLHYQLDNGKKGIEMVTFR